MGGVVQRLGERLAHQRGGADRGVEPGVVDHLDDGAHAVALLADQPGERARVLDLGRGVGAVAELVLEALDQDGVARAVGAPARHQEAGQARRRLRQGQEAVGHRRRAEPLVAGQLVGAVAERARLRGVGAHVGAALLLGHRHADQHARLVGGGPGPRIVGGRQDLRAARCSASAGRIAQRRGGGEGHGERAADAAFDLVEQEGGRRAHDMGAGPAHRSRAARAPARRRPAQQLVPGRVELDLVDAMAETVVAAQLRRVAVGLLAEPDGRCSPEPRAEPAQALLAPGAALALDRLEQRAVLLEPVDLLERRRLVRDFVGAERRYSCGHRRSSRRPVGPRNDWVGSQLM